MRPLIFLAALATTATFASTASAAAPNYILVSGPGLTHPVLMAKWSENLRLLSAVANARKATGAAVRVLAQRPRLDLAEFWAWSGRPRPTRPNEANQHGWFYPAHASTQAVIELTVNGTAAPRFVPAVVLKILELHGIPTRQ
jgi:hypothetical protein